MISGRCLRTPSSSASSSGASGGLLILSLCQRGTCEVRPLPSSIARQLYRLLLRTLKNRRCEREDCGGPACRSSPVHLQSPWPQMHPSVLVGELQAGQEIWISVQRWDYHVSGRYSHAVDFMFEGQVEGGTLAGIPVAATVQAVEGHDPRNTEFDSSTLTLGFGEGRYNRQPNSSFVEFWCQ